MMDAEVTNSGSCTSRVADAVDDLDIEGGLGARATVRQRARCWTKKVRELVPKECMESATSKKIKRSKASEAERRG